MRLNLTPIALLALALIATPAWPAQAAGGEPRAGNPRGYETDILVDIFGFGPDDLDAEFDHIYQGCPQRDCIPSIDQPGFLEASRVAFLEPDDLVLSLSLAGITRAYPTMVLDRHEIVNDRFGEIPVAVTYCPLCGSGVAFRREVAGQETEFGVSGLLHNNDLILYDRRTRSLWQQITGRSLGGPRRGDVLEPIPLTIVEWQDWLAAHPDGSVLKPPGGLSEYQQRAYGDYAESDRLLFPVSAQDARLHPKRVVYGLVVDGQSLAVDSGWLLERGSWATEVGDRSLRFSVDAAGGVEALLDGARLPVHRMYWFAWYSFHPGTALIDARNH